MSSHNNELGQPIGPALGNWQPPTRPVRRVLEGRWCRVEPLDAARHGPELHAANSLDREGRMWTYLHGGPFASLVEYLSWLEPRPTSDDPLFFAFVDAASGRATGLGSYLRIEPASGSIEVGHLQFSPLLQRTPAATEVMYLMMRNAFELGYRRYEWKCDALNAASRRAAERLGFTFEGVFRQATVYKGRSRDTAWYSIIDSEWPTLERGFRAWLEPSNFDESGRQRRSLAECRARSAPVVARGDRRGYGSDPAAVATFVGVAPPRPMLEVPVLVSRLLALLDSTARLTEQIPDDALGAKLPGRDRTHLGLAYHVPQVVVGFLDAALGGRLTFEHFERKPPEHFSAVSDVARLTRSVSQALAVWWGANQARLPATVDTFYGVQPLHDVLERTTWHVAQHARQLQRLLERRGLTPSARLAPALFEGLHLPADVWDDEVPLT